jgi:hypothetical protein
MRGKIARALRNAAGFKPNADRAYETWQIPRMKHIYQVGMAGEINVVEREVNVEIVECVEGSRKIYQDLKRQYNGFEASDDIMEMPEQSDVDALKKQYDAELLERKEVEPDKRVLSNDLTNEATLSQNAKEAKDE